MTWERVKLKGHPKEESWKMKEEGKGTFRRLYIIFPKWQIKAVLASCFSRKPQENRYHLLTFVVLGERPRVGPKKALTIAE